MDKINLSLNEAGSLLLGAGLLRLTTDLTSGIIVVVVGAALKVLVAVLKKKGIVISSKPQ